MKKLFALLLLCSCSAVSNSPPSDAPVPLDPSLIVAADTSPEAQARFKVEWLALTRGKVFSGEPNLWGGGAFGVIHMAFDAEGNLHNSFPWEAKWYGMHRIMLFKSGSEACVMLYKSATSSALLKGEVYSLEIRGNKLYRTQNIYNNAARGWTSYAAWDKKSYTPQYLEAIGAEDASLTPPALTVPDKNS